MPLCNGADIGCVSHIDNITGRESGLTSLYGAEQRMRWELSQRYIGSGDSPQGLVADWQLDA